MTSRSRKPSANTAGPWGAVRRTMRDSQTWISETARLTWETRPLRAPWPMDDICGHGAAVTLCACRQSQQHDDGREPRSVQRPSDGVEQSKAIALIVFL